MRTVICNDPIEGFLTKGRQYTVLSERPEEKRLVMIDDRGLEGWFNESRFSPLLAPQVAPNFSQMQQIADEVKITCPVVESANELYPDIMKSPLRTAYERIAELEALVVLAIPSMENSEYSKDYNWAQTAKAVLKRGAQ